MTKDGEVSDGKKPVVDHETIPHTSPFYLHPSESPGQLFGSDLLSDLNYGEWVNDMTETLIAKKKLNFVDGSLPRSAADTRAKEDAWDQCDAMVKGWLKTAMTKEVRNSVRAAKTAQEIWMDLKQRFGSSSAMRAYELRRQIVGLRQEKSSTSAFFTKLRTLWDEHQSVTINPRCSCGNCSCDIAKQVRDKQEAEWLNDFLLGLDDTFAIVRSQILSSKPTPTLTEAYQQVAAEEQQRQITASRKPVVEAAAFQVRNEKERDSDDRVRCSNCNKLGHLREQCFRLIGYPPDFGKNRPNGGKKQKGENSSRAAHVDAEESPIPGLTASQFAQLKQFFSAPTPATPDPTAHMAGNSIDLSEWLIDSGCNEHIVSDINWFDQVHYSHGHSPVRIPNGKCIPVEGIGSVVLNSQLTLHRVLHVPQFKCNLLSVSRLIRDNNVALFFLGNVCVIQDSHSKTVIGLGRLRDGLFYLSRDEKLQKRGDSTLAMAAAQRVSQQLWHHRLGHPAFEKLSALRNFLTYQEHSWFKSHCDSCLRAKQTRTPFQSSTIKTAGCFELIHMDIWGGYQTSSMDGSRYFLTVVDDYSRTTWVYLLKYKSDVERHVRMFCEMVRTQFQTQVRRIQSDNGLEFQTNTLRDYYAANGILFQTSCVNTPQQNGVAERKHRHLLETARALRFHAGLPVRFWGECVLTATYLINRLPSSVLGNKTPFEVLLERAPSYDHLRTFGCLVYAKDTQHGLDKFAERGRRCVFVGYPLAQKGYRVYDLTSRRIYTSRDVFFVEGEFPFRTPLATAPSTRAAAPHSPPASIEGEQFSDSPVLDPIEHEEDTNVAPACSSQQPTSADETLAPTDLAEVTPPHAHADLDEADPSHAHADLDEAAPSSAAPPTSDQHAFVPRRGLRERRPPSKLDIYDTALPGSSSHATTYPIANHVHYDRFTPAHKAFLAAISKLEEPRHFREAVLHAYWREAMQKEILALEANGTWTLEYLPPGKRAIDSKWVYKIKYHPDGSIERFKARLVAKGFNQLEGVDFHDTFAPVAKVVTVRVLIALAAQRGWPLHQLDVNNAFLHGDLEEEVYMKVPLGFQQEGDTRVCRLRKSLYGLRQASRNWYQKFTLALAELGFTASRADHSLFLYRKGETFVAALIYVDDVVLTGNDAGFISQVKSFLDSRFSIKDLGPLKYFLGIEVARSPEGIVLSQRKYTLDILKDAGVTGARPSSFPMEQNHSLTQPADDVIPDISSYRRLIGRLLYLTVTRPDITYAVNVLSQHVHAPSSAHMAAAHRVLRYLKTAPGQGLFFPSSGTLELTAFCDSDWAGCQASRRSTSGYYIQLGSAPVSWRTKKQRVVARSSAEAEYRAMASTVSEVIWLRHLLMELGVPQSSATPLYCDSQAALHIAANPVFHERTKHVEMDCYFVRERVVTGEIAPHKVATSDQPADMFTKALGTDQFRFLMSKLGIRDLHASA
ncbi:unnamed protein product [Linum trigynum]|uniref:Polyprotein n=1 Tax=Linum trigynum TaxID=586398 RepID=A0AAV2FJW3_9ROSI